MLRLWLRKLYGRWSRAEYPHHGGCHRCGTVWALTTHHTTPVVEHEWGMFPLCEPCWAELTPAARIPFSRRLFEEWMAVDRRDRRIPEYRWDDIARAVMEGK